jgi:hypothetical protein
MDKFCYYKVKRHYKYKTAYDCVYQDKRFENLFITAPFIIIKDSVLTVKAGYAWDGPSGPTVDTPSFMEGSCIHDALYQLIRMKVLPPAFRAKADDILEEVCVKRGKMWKLRAKWVRWGVGTWFGKQAAKPRPEENKLICVGG